MSDVTDHFGPLTSDHPLVGTECPACHQPLEVGQRPALVLLGPGADEEARSKARQGVTYTGVAQPVHRVCATGRIDGNDDD